MVLLYHDPCPTCDPNNLLGYVCPIPVPTAPGQRIPRDRGVPQGHVICGFCEDLIPLRGIAEEKCASCELYSCHKVNEFESCPDSKLTKFQGDATF